MMEKPTRREWALEAIRRDMREVLRGVESTIRNNIITRQEAEAFVSKTMSEEYNRFMSMSDEMLVADILDSMSKEALMRFFKEALNRNE